MACISRLLYNAWDDYIKMAKEVGAHTSYYDCTSTKLLKDEQASQCTKIAGSLPIYARIVSKTPTKNWFAFVWFRYQAVTKQLPPICLPVLCVLVRHRRLQDTGIQRGMRHLGRHGLNEITPFHSTFLFSIASITIS